MNATSPVTWIQLGTDIGLLAWCLANGFWMRALIRLGRTLDRKQQRLDEAERRQR